MRDIKFRAWEKNDHMMYEVSEMVFSHVGIDWRAKGDHALASWRGDANFMQYTGLKDKNGKEIYEGDIVRGWTGYGGITFKPVEWEQYRLRFYAYPTGRADRDWFERVSSFEVIGNIYENPELLESTS